MQFTFDGFDRYEIPVLTLCNPNFDELYVIDPLHQPEMQLRFNAISEMSFSVCEQDADGTPLPYYELISKNRLVHMSGFGYWVISDTEVTSTGGVETKEVNCYSYEYMLSLRNVDLDAGTYQFYDFTHPDDTLLGRVIRRTPSWTIGEVSDSLMSKHRTFELPETSVYSFLTNDVAEAYEAIFEFDTENRRINAYDTTDIIKETSIVFTWDNLMKYVTITETDDTVTTALDVYGSGTFNVNRVNPLGTPTIYRFDYFADQMTPALWNKVKLWQDAVDAEIMGTADDNYSSLLLDKRGLYEQILGLNAESAELLAYAESGKNIQDINIPYSLSYSSQSGVTGFYSWINSQNQDTLKNLLLAATSYPPINLEAPPSGTSGYASMITPEDGGIAQALINIYACNRCIEYNNSLITGLNAQIDAIDASMETINGSLAFDSYFTTEELLELDKFIFGNTYTNEYYVLSDIMTDAEVQDLAQELYQQGKTALERISQPNYNFDLESVNLLFIKEYMPFIEQFALGSIVNAEIREGVWVTPILLEVSFSYEEPDDFSLTWGNRFRLQSDEWTWAELNDQVTKTSGGVSANFSDMIKPVRSGQYAEVHEFITSALDAATNNILAGNNQSIIIDQHGLLGMKASVDESGAVIPNTYDDEQIKIINNLLCFTDDGWLTTKTALGRIDLGDGNYTWGLVAESIFGELIAGDRLYISNEGGTFMVDGSGATLLNSSFTIQNETGANSLGRIIANAADGFKLQTRDSAYSNTAWGQTPSSAIHDQITMGMDGSVTINGSLVAVETVGGWKNEANQLGYGAGTFFAQLGSGSTPSINADAFSAGTMNGSSKTPKFRVTYGGKLTATDADISGTVNATSGSFSNMTVTGTLNCSGATFSGGTFNNISAWGGSFNNISASGTITGSTIIGGTVSGSTISGGTIQGSGGYFSGVLGTSPYYGWRFNGNNCELIQGGSTSVTLNGGTVTLSQTYSTIGRGFGEILDSHLQFGNNVIACQGQFRPMYDNTYTCGSPSWRWSLVYAVVGTIQTSDRKKKNSIASLDPDVCESFINELKPSSYKINNDASGKEHWGLIAQDVEEALTSVGLSIDNFAGLTVQDTTNDAEYVIGEDTFYGLTYEEFIAPMIAVIKKQGKELKDLKSRISALENGVT